MEQSRDQTARVSHEEEVPPSPIFRASGAAKHGQGDPSAQGLLSSAHYRRGRRSDHAFPNHFLPEGLLFELGKKCPHSLPCGTVRRVRMVTLGQGEGLSEAVAYESFGINWRFQNELSNFAKKKKKRNSIKKSKCPPAHLPITPFQYLFIHLAPRAQYWENGWPQDSQPGLLMINGQGFPC